MCIRTMSMCVRFSHFTSQQSLYWPLNLPANSFSFTRRGNYVLNHEEEELIRKTHQGLMSNAELVKSQYIMFSPRDMYRDSKELGKMDSLQPETQGPTSGSTSNTLASKSCSVESLGWTDMLRFPDEDSFIWFYRMRLPHPFWMIRRSSIKRKVASHDFHHVEHVNLRLYLQYIYK